MRCILHADLDAFYASVEQRDRPLLRGRPVIVGGTGARGVVSAASYEARRFGVRSAMPTAQARKLCPEGVFLRGDMARYQRESKRVFAIFRDSAPTVEALSIDEAFLDLSGTQRLLGPPVQVAERLRARVRAETGLALSVGIAPVKLVAKIASSLAKPDGLLEVTPDRMAAFLAPLPVSVLWGVGPVAEARLAKLGIQQVGQLAAFPGREVEQVLGDWGSAIAKLARGEDSREVEPYREAVSYSEENTFDRDVRDPARLEAAIRAHAEAVARRLRRDGLLARVVAVKLKLARRTASGPRGFPLLTRRCTLDVATDDGQILFEAAREQLDRAGLSEPVRLIGVAASGLTSERESQLALFADPKQERQQRRQRLNRALDEIHARFGRAALTRAEEADVSRASPTQQLKRGEWSGDGD